MTEPNGHVNAAIPPVPQRPVAPDLDGVDVVLADGRAWIFPHPGLTSGFSDLRDRLYDQMVIRGAVEESPVYEAAYLLLTAAYRLAQEEVEPLLLGTPMGTLTEGVVEALFPLEADGRARTYTNWVVSAFHANGIAPGSVPPGMVPLVMRQLVQTKRAIPAGEFIASVEAVAKRKHLLGALNAN